MDHQDITPENVKAIREFNKMTISKMADALGMSARNYQRFEEGKFEMGVKLREMMAKKLDHLGLHLLQEPISQPDQKAAHAKQKSPLQKLKPNWGLIWKIIAGIAVILGAIVCVIQLIRWYNGIS